MARQMASATQTKPLTKGPHIWLFIPSHCVQAPEGLSLDSGWPSEITYQPFVTLSGKPTQRPLSWRGWQTRPWIRLLSGMMLEPLTASRGVDSWISSVRDTRVSHSPLLAKDWLRRTLGTFGLRLLASLARWSPATCFARMLPLTSPGDLSKSLPNFKQWVTQLQRDYSVRRKWGRHTEGNGFISSHEKI